VRPSEVVPSEELKTKMVELLKNRGKPYGILIRKMDFPFGGSFDEIRRMLVRHAQAGASGKAASPPVLAYKVFADGREEMVRGLQFRALSARSMKDILAASDELHAFEFMDNGAPLSMSGGGGYVSEACVVAPSVLVDDLELRRYDDDLPKTPTVPAPTIVVSR
jgi:TldD protein